MISDERFAEALRIGLEAIKDAQEQTQADFTPVRQTFKD